MAAAPARSSFDDEVFEYWIPRLVADGVDAGDVGAVRARVSGWDDWPGAWEEAGDAHLALARERRAAGARLTAGEALVRASLCYHFGQLPATGAPAAKRRLQASKVAAFREAAPLLDPPAERVETAHEGASLPGYLRLPAGGAPPLPCVVLVPGLDSTKEDFFALSEMCVRRGLAAFAFDGPGQGEARGDALLADGYERCVASVLDVVAALDVVDAGRVGLLGRSLGGHYVLRAAASDPRVAACVAFGGCYDLSDWEAMPRTILDGFRHATGSATDAEARARMGEATLADCIGRVSCPVLVVHGRRDAIFRAAQAERIAAELGDRAVLAIDEDGVHCCHNHAFAYRTLMIDWLADALGTAAANASGRPWH